MKDQLDVTCYFISLPYVLNMFRTLIYPSSGACDYVILQEQIYQPDKGIAMGSPISGTIAELFLQHLEHTHIRPLIESKQILYYTRYIDDILIIYDTDNTKQEKLAQHANSMHNNLQFNRTQESNEHINFLDLTIIRRTSHRINWYLPKTDNNRHNHTLHIHPP